MSRKVTAGDKSPIHKRSPRIGQLRTNPKYRQKYQHNYFDDLPPEQQGPAYAMLERFILRHRDPTQERVYWMGIPPWRLGTLVGVCRREAKRPGEKDSKWGKKMRCTKGGRNVQHYYKAMSLDPMGPANQAKKKKRTRRTQQAEVNERKRINWGLAGSLGPIA